MENDAANGVEPAAPRATADAPSALRTNSPATAGASRQVAAKSELAGAFGDDLVAGSRPCFMSISTLSGHRRGRLAAAGPGRESALPPWPPGDPQVDDVQAND